MKNNQIFIATLPRSGCPLKMTPGAQQRLIKVKNQPQDTGRTQGGKPRFTQKKISAWEGARGHSTAVL